MNEFGTYFLEIMNSQTGIYHLGFKLGNLIYILTGICLASFFSKGFGVKQYTIGIVIGLIIKALQVTFEAPFDSFDSNPRLQNIKSDALSYIFAMLIGLSGIIIAIVNKKKRKLEVIAFSASLFIITMLVYSYHVVIINGGLKSAAASNEVQLDKIARSPESTFLYFCSTNQGYTCFDGDVRDLKEDTKNITSEFYAAYSDMKQFVEHPSFKFSNVSAPAEVKYSLVFIQAGENYRLIMETEQAEYLFKTHSIQFHLFANAAVLFWTLGALLVVFLHKRKRRRY